MTGKSSDTLKDYQKTATLITNFPTPIYTDVYFFLTETSSDRAFSKNLFTEICSYCLKDSLSHKLHLHISSL